MKLISNKVLFIPKDKETEICVPRPQSSKKYIPEWFKKMPSLVKTVNEYSQDGTAKMCMPFLDSLVSGYTQELICDIYIDCNTEDDDPEINYKWAGKTCSLGQHWFYSRVPAQVPCFW
jgi:hypothetical protein